MLYATQTTSIRITNTVEFFPHQITMPKLTPLDTVAMILTQLRELLSDLPNDQPLNTPHHDLLSSLYAIQKLLGIGTGTDEPLPTSKGGRGPARTHSRPITCSKTCKLHPIGTIIRKRFDQAWYEGEVTKHDPGSNYYHIKYTDGDAEEMTYREVQQYQKPLQTYSPRTKTTFCLLYTF